MTMPTAFSTAMLAWGLLSFKGGYTLKGGTTLEVQQQIVWGADYLLKTVQQVGAGYNLVYQVPPLKFVRKDCGGWETPPPTQPPRAVSKLSRFHVLAGTGKESKSDKLKHLRSTARGAQF
jgi:hypothetical protein